MNNNEEFQLTEAQRKAGNVVAGAYVVLCGIFLLLVGLNLFAPLTLENSVVWAILIAIGLIFFTTALIQKNTVSMWLAFTFIAPATVTILNNYTALTYAQLYPLYIAIPAISSIFTAIISKDRYFHLKIIAFFGITAGIFALQSSGLVGWGVVIPVLLVLAGLIITLLAIRGNREKNNE